MLILTFYKQHREKIVVVKVTIQKIAELCGVSIMTVSRVFNPEKAAMVRESTRQKVLAVAKEYNYHPVMIGKSFMTGKTYKVGLILDSMTSDLSSPTFSRFMEGACAELQSRNYTLVLLLAKEVEKHSGANVSRLLSSKVADGYILGKSMLLEAVKGALNKAPVVLLSSQEGDVPEVFKHIQIRRSPVSAFKAMWELIPAELRKSVALVAPEEKYYTRSGRAQLIGSLAPAGAEVKNFFSPHRPGFLVDRANAAAVAEEHFAELRKYKVIWGVSDLYALGVADVFRRHGLLPGRDYYLLGVDNLEPAMQGVEPVLTTCDQRWDEVGRVAAITLLDMIAGKTIEERELAVVSRVVRRTSL